MRLPPILIIHGKKDTTVPTSSSQEFYDHCRTAIDSIDEDEEDEEEEKKKKKKKKKKKNLRGGQKKIEIQFLSEMDHSSYLADISFLKKGEENLLLNNIMNFVQDVVGGGAGDICQVEWSNSNNEVIELIHVVDSVMKKCPWAKTKTANQLLSYTVSELEEIKEAIDNRGVDGGKEEETSSDDLESEVGDLLFDAILLARTCERDFSNCSLNRMFSRVAEKIRRRCPHVFAGEMCTSPEEAGMIWQREKLKEKSMVMVKSNGKKTED
jgi:NTP pyrophosphatase (non-canonical NTP hydrolase)